MKILCLLAVLLLPSEISAQECRADLNGSGQTDITDIITAVNESLFGCGARTPIPTPAATCPFDFEDDLTTSNLRCFYEGNFNFGCGQPLLATWISNGSLVVINIDTEPIVSIGAEVTGPTSATVVAWSPDGFDTANDWNGSASFNRPGQLVVQVGSQGGFAIDGCAFSDYFGDFLEVIDISQASRISSPAHTLRAFGARHRGHP